jgi:microcystin-dependent protein
MDAFIGTIMLFGGSYAPDGWAYCNGDLLLIQRNAALYSLLGIQYGGDGINNFALPNLPTVKDTDGKGESKYIICLNGLYPMRS